MTNNYDAAESSKFSFSDMIEDAKEPMKVSPARPTSFPLRV